MNDIKMTQEAINKLSRERYDDESLESINSCLYRAAGMAGFLGYASSLGDGHEIIVNDMEYTIKVLELEIRDAIIILEDYWNQQRELSD